MEYQRVKFETIKKPERFKGGREFLDSAIEYATAQIFTVMKDFVHRYPSSASENLIYQPFADNFETDWSMGFWTGMLWISYELTQNDIYRAVAEAQFDDYQAKYDDFTSFWHHDIGFIYIPSIVAQYKITGAKKAKELALKAADALANRYSENAGIIQWKNKAIQGQFIIDCCMNVPLLFWASHITGDRSYFVKALSHMYRAAECMIRDDASTYQCYQIDEVTGEPIRGWTGQGHDDESCWARGQTWAMYGLTLAYRYAKDGRILEMAKRVCNYFLNRLPGDLICNWDLMYTQDDEQRDSSSAPVAACALLELAKYLKDDDPHKEIYVRAAESMVRSLAEKYTTKGRVSNGLLMHGVYCKSSWGDDECCMWGDYFYMEALIRLKQDWNVYW